MMKTSTRWLGMIAVAVAFTWGCSREPASGPAASVSPPSAEGRQYIAAAEPAGAVGVTEARRSARDKEEIVVVGRIGGEVDPWVAESAAFSIVDQSFKPCSEIEGDSCPTPWDYCCDDPKQLSKGKAMVEFVDADGQPVSIDARKLLGVKELTTVVVKGTARRDGDGLTILAREVYLK